MVEKRVLKKVSGAQAQDEEGNTIKVMINLYCRDHHLDPPPCDSCLELFEYTIERLRQCPLQEKRTTCGQCKIHCYNPSMQKKIKEVMRYAGPRMFKAQPILAAKHLLKGLSRK